MALRIGFVSIIRPLFKGDSPGAAARSLEQLKRLGEQEGFEVVTANVSGNDAHVASGREIPPFAVSNLDTARQAAAQLKDEALDFLLVQHTTFSTGDLLAPLLHAAKRVGVWALPEPAQRGPLPFNALCGLNMTLSFLEHPQVNKREPVKWFYGAAEDDWFLQRLTPTLLALRGLRAVEGARILQVGGTAPAFYGLEERPGLPVTVDTMDLAEVFDRVAAVPEGEARARAADWAKEESAQVSDEHLERAARVELALKSLAAEGSYDAIALRCWPEFPESCGAMVCASVARLGDAEIPTTCEGDVMGATSMLALQGMSGAPAMLMDLSDLAEGSLQFWHCGNAPIAWAATGGTRLTTHFNRDTLGVVRDMVIRPGPATGFRLLSEGRRALIFSGAFGEPGKPSFDGVRGWLGDLRWGGQPLDARTFVANVLDYRLPHHFAFGSGELSEGLSELCGWLGSSALEPKSLRNVL